MSALTIDGVSTVPTRGRARSRHLVVVPVGAPASDVATGQLRLTRRGRLAITLVVALLLAAFAVVGAQAAWAAPVAPTAPTTAAVTVLPGQTLWQIASTAAPGSDPRDAIIEIRQLNDLPDSRVFAGQVLTVPAG